jgi:hypothetical protein
VENPDLAKYFLEKPETGEVVESISNLPLPEVDESLPIYDHWEKMAQRMMMALSRHQSAWIFFEPVDPAALNIPDYFEIVKTPMDFGTIKSRLKEAKYRTVKDFLCDLDLVFHNCRIYNGENTYVGSMGKQVYEEYLRLRQQISVDFYVKSLPEEL